jgi:nucleoside-diphosphate-sugar epimerase
MSPVCLPGKLLECDFPSFEEFVVAPACPARQFRSVMILGARGFIGRWLVNEFQDASNPNAVLPLDLRDFPTRGDCYQALEDALHRGAAPDLIIHAAGLVGSASEADLHAAHVESTEILLQSVAHRGISPRIVVIGSAAEYGVIASDAPLVESETPPAALSPYGQSKVQQSQIARELAEKYQLDLLRVRLFNTLGPGQSPSLVAAAMIERLREARRAGQQTFRVLNPSHTRDYLDVRDVARCVRRLAERLESGPQRPPVHVCSGEGATVAALAGELLATANLPIAPVFEHTAPESRMIGDHATLRHVLQDEPIRRISTYASLADMWRERLSHSDL